MVSLCLDKDYTTTFLPAAHPPHTGCNVTTARQETKLIRHQIRAPRSDSVSVPRCSGGTFTVHMQLARYIEERLCQLLNVIAPNDH